MSTFLCCTIPTYLPTYLRTESLTIYVGRSIKTHLYWAMKNYGEDPDKLYALIMNIADHYQVCSDNHSMYSLVYVLLQI